MVIHHAAMSDYKGSAYFPTKIIIDEVSKAVEPGLEVAGLDGRFCSMENQDELNEYCTKVPVTTMDEHFADIIKQRQLIHVLKVDSEGWDYPILFRGGLNVLRLTEYLEFEYHHDGAWQNYTLQSAIDQLDGMGFTCYWAGKSQLWRITGCWFDHYGYKYWSNVACAHRRLAPALENHMEHIFEQTIAQAN
uniref:Methyltransferase FkbM domain-containing protein n=1 Tax=Cyclophora tenuis TaxID=216820 RepID=A0A7S1GKV0_CYCTE